MDINVIIEKKENIDTNSIKGKRKEMDIDAIEEKKEVQDDKEKSKDVFKKKGEELNLEKLLSSGLKKMESEDSLKEVNLGSKGN